MQDAGLKEYLLKTPSADKWQRSGLEKRAGIIAPLFFIHSKKSVGIGDFTDLKLLIDFARKTGNSIIQLLPMNEIGGVFCPYDSVSSFALEPAYLALQNVPCANDNTFSARIKKLRREFSLARKTRIDYCIKEEKIKLLWDIFSAKEPDDPQGLDTFNKENSYWISDFALFKVLKKHHQEKPWYEWYDEYKSRDPKAIIDFMHTHDKEIRFQKWLQYLCFEQFKQAKDYAKENNILLKGDLPILVSRDSADVWAHPNFFKLDFAAGAPPDMYCAKGQRWGMPTYNWEVIALFEYKYLKEKLKYAENFYDILRIDHVVGLFRIWSIRHHEPEENKGLNGFFDPADPNKWSEHGRNILSVILANTRMLLCAEDLGIIPEVCIRTLAEFGIPGNDVQRWVKDWNVKHDFLAPGDYRALSVAMLSTHDTTDWAAWWENEAGTVDEGLFVRMCESRGINYVHVKDRLFDFNLSRHRRLRWQNNIDSVDKLTAVLNKRAEEVGDFIDMYKNTYQEKERLWKHFDLGGPMREKCDVEIIKCAFKITLASRAIFCIELITDWLTLAKLFQDDPYSCRINTPGTVSKDNWSLLMPMPLEDLLKHKACAEIKELISSSGRI